MIKPIMTKIQVILLGFVIIPVLYGLPLEQEENLSRTSQSHERKENPFLSRQINTEKSQENSNDTDDKSYVEETFIEVLVPGSPQLNSSALSSFLNSSIFNSTSEKQSSDHDRHRETRDSFSEERGRDESARNNSSEKNKNNRHQEQIYTKPILYASNAKRSAELLKEEKDDVSEQSRNYQSSTLAPVLFHGQNNYDNSDQSSFKSPVQVKQERNNSTKTVGSTSFEGYRRVIRDTKDNQELKLYKQNQQTHVYASKKSGNSSVVEHPGKPTENRYRREADQNVKRNHNLNNTESVFYVTPQAKKLIPSKL